jgi:hypothetical protein
MVARQLLIRFAFVVVCALGWVCGLCCPARADPPPGHSVPRESGPPLSSAGLFRLNYDQLKYLAHLPSYGFVVLQSYMRGEIPQIRGAAPHLRVFMYFNSSGAYDGPDPDFPPGLPLRSTMTAHPYWAVRGKTGNPVTFWGGALHLYDIGDPGYQRAWASRAVADARSGGFDGIFVDDVNFGEAARPGWAAPSPKYDTDLKWTLATESFLKTVSPIIHKAGLLEMANVGSNWNSDIGRAVAWAKITHGYFREHFLRWGDDGGTPVFKKGDWTWMTTLERRVEAAGVPFYAGTYGPARGEEKAMRYARFSYLLFDSRPGGGFAWFSPRDPYNGAWADDLGTPVTTASHVGSVWTRRLAGGTIRVDTATGQAEVVVKAG